MMPATVTNLADWKASHPPALKLWRALEHLFLRVFEFRSYS